MYIGTTSKILKELHYMIQQLAEKVSALETENKSLRQQLKAVTQGGSLNEEDPELFFHHLTSRSKHKGDDKPVSLCTVQIYTCSFGLVTLYTQIQIIKHKPNPDW